MHLDGLGGHERRPGGDPGVRRDIRRDMPRRGGQRTGRCRRRHDDHQRDARSRQFRLGQLITLTATVTDNDTTSVPTGSVEFNNGVKTLGTDGLDDAGKASVTTTVPAIGNDQTINAVYTPDNTSTFVESSGSTQVSVAKADT
ncbi:MAG TPA: Ig-like domain-containing protein, partial [Jatrophihabitantaceae bacterium]